MSAGGRSVVGVLPALGSGLTDLRRSGQHDRLLDYDLRQYAQAYDRVYYWSYFEESLAEFTRDPFLLDRIVLLPKRGRWPARLYALLLPLVYRREFSLCEALRVEQFSGALPALVARQLYGVPFAVTYGYHYAEVARIAGSRLTPWLYRRLEGAVFPRAAGVIVTSPEMKARLTADPRRPRLAYFPNGVDTERFAPPSAPRPATSPRTVLYVGRLEPEKNVGRLIDAIATMAGPPVQLVAIGDGSQRAELTARARAAGVDARFLGVVPHGLLAPHFQGADCFALPSLTEGHPKALIEALASGLPCAASARGGIPSIVEDGVTGLLFDPENPADMGRAIGRLLTDRVLAAGLAARGRAVAVARYDVRALLRDEVRFVQSISAPAQVARRFEDYAVSDPIDDTVPEFVGRQLARLARAKPRTVLDLGAGDGRYLNLWKTLLPGDAVVVGCEISLRRAERIKTKGYRVVVARSESLPFKPGSFDLVTLIEVIEHTESPGASLDEIARALAPGGTLALTTPNYPMKRLFDLRAALRQRSWARWKDDPTHVSKMSAGRLERLLVPRFARVELEGTAIFGEGHLRRLGALRHSRAGRWLANKLFAVCAKAR